MATRVLIAGGGVAALEAALALRALAEDRVRVELLAPETQFWYRPLAVADFGVESRRIAAASSAAPGKPPRTKSTRMNQPAVATPPPGRQHR